VLVDVALRRADGCRRLEAMVHPSDPIRPASEVL
jgi:hypothetical protein